MLATAGRTGGPCRRDFALALGSGEAGGGRSPARDSADIVTYQQSDAGLWEGTPRWRPRHGGAEVVIVAEVLFYERPVPLNRIDHKDLRLKGVPNLKFAMKAHSVPLTGTEFFIAARDLMIVRTKTCTSTPTVTGPPTRMCPRLSGAIRSCWPKNRRASPVKS
jgi:hypothetical protein